MKETSPLRIVIIVLVTCAAMFTLLVAGVITVIVLGIDSKSSATRSDTPPGRPSAWATPIQQTESHTCGYLSLAAAYKVYSLSPEEKNIRFRLGVDRAAQPFDEHSTGTLHPDLFRVLNQDGFHYQAVDPDDPASIDQVREHLGTGHLVMLLIQRRQNRALHWVLADDCAEETIRIVDSLETDPYDEPIADFLENHALSVILIDTDLSPGARPHSDGIAEMNRVRMRIEDRQGESAAHEMQITPAGR